MESNLVTEFIAQTGADSTLAYKYLQDKNWDLNLAVKTYRYGLNGLSPTNINWPPPLETEENGNISEPRRMLSRPSLQKSDAIDLTDVKKLTRGISRATDNINIVSKARSNIAINFQDSNNAVQCFIETPLSTFTLPDLTVFPEDFRGFLEKDLIETSTLVSLEQSGRLNWWADNGVCQRLWPLATTGDGNCLLHAASLGMWGFHDRLLTLRKALYAFMTSSSYRNALWRRWRWQQSRLNAEAGFIYSKEEWQKEWDSIVNMASTEPRKLPGRRRSMIFDKNGDDLPENATYESLEEIHVLALAHVLRRPIVVIADLMLKGVNGDDLAPIPFGGIYLPLECPPSDCHRSPLVLTYDAAHFSSLVVMEKEGCMDKTLQPPAMIPVTDSEHELLPIQFSIDPGENFIWGEDDKDPVFMQKFMLDTKDKLSLLNEYLDIVQVPILPTPSPDDCDGINIEVDFAENYNGRSNDEEEIDKRYTGPIYPETNDESMQPLDSQIFSNNKSKAAKQLQSVAKQFGSIGKSMSKKLKKNLGSITKITRSNSQKKSPVRQTTKTNSSVSRSQDFILCAVLHMEKRPHYQEEMIHNYLQSAELRFYKDKDMKQKQAEERRFKEEQKMRDIASYEGPSKCINAGCDQLGTAMTSYMCKTCFEKQRDQELSTGINSPTFPRISLNDPQGAPRYGTGKSRFYTESDANSHDIVSRLPTSRAVNNLDNTLYLSKSTFYNDSASRSENGDLKSENIIRYPEELMGSTRYPSLALKYSSNCTSGIQDQNDLMNNGSGSRQNVSRLHSYNMWDDGLAGNHKTRPLKILQSHKDSSQSSSVAELSSDKVDSRISSRVLAGSAPVTTSVLSRNISVSSLSPQSSCDLPTVERVSRPASDSHSRVCLPIVGSQPCRTNNCKFFGSADSNFYCSKCYKEITRSEGSSGIMRVQELKR